MPLCLFFPVFRSSDTWVSLELGKKGKMERHGKLRSFIGSKGFYTSLDMFSISNTFLLLRIEMIQRIASKQRILGKSRGLVCFLLLFGNVAGEHISIAPFVFLKWVFKWVLHSCGHYNRLKWGNILLSVSQACQLYRFSRSYLSFTPAISSLFSIWIPYLYFDCQYFCRYCHNNCFS